MTVNTRPLPDSDPIALLRVADLRTAETDAAAVLPPHTLMGRAGAAAAHWLSERMAGDDRPVWFAVGPATTAATRWLPPPTSSSLASPRKRGCRCR